MDGMKERRRKGKMPLGYKLSGIVNIRANLVSRVLTLELRHLSYELEVDDLVRLDELIAALQSFKRVEVERKEDVSSPDFYKGDEEK
jgi:hypothetical protein